MSAVYRRPAPAAVRSAEPGGRPERASIPRGLRSTALPVFRMAKPGSRGLSRLDTSRRDMILPNTLESSRRAAGGVVSVAGGRT
jgi:hypothetical protein